MDATQEEIRIMMDQNRWPYNYLPLIRVTRHNLGQQTAFLVRGHGPVVYFGNIWLPENSDRRLAEFPTRKYGDFTAIVRDGWRID